MTSNNIFDALSLIRSQAVRRRWIMPSASEPARVHQVEENPLSCTCKYFTEWFVKTQRPCRHLWAGPGAPVAFFIEAMQAAKSDTELAQVVAIHADAIKNCDAVFKQVARRVYSERHQALNFVPSDKPVQAKATTMSNLVTPRQLGAIRAIANSIREDAETICKKELDCKPEELSRKGASWLIDFLKAQDQIDLNITA